METCCFPFLLLLAKHGYIYINSQVSRAVNDADWSTRGHERFMPLLLVWGFKDAVVAQPASGGKAFVFPVRCYGKGAMMTGWGRGFIIIPTPS